MSYTDRRKQVIWTSPSGQKFNLLTDEKIKFSRKRKGEVKNNPTRSYGKKNGKTSYKTVNTSDDTFHDMGSSGRDLSLKIYFIGDNHDIEANNFDKAYCELGKSKLQLPYGGIINVQALDIDYEQDYVSTSNLTAINISFHECGTTRYPTAKIANKTATKKNLSQAQETVAQSFGDTVEKLEDKETFAQQWSANIDKLAEKFEGIQNSEFIGVLGDIQSQNILNNPYIMATQVGILLKKGLLTYQNVSYVLDTTASLLSAFLPTSSGSISKSEYTADDLFAKQTIIAASDVIADYEFEIRKEATQTAERIQDMNDEYVEKSQIIEKIINENLEDTVISEVDTTETVNDVISSITENIEDLKIEKTFCLKELSNPILLAFEYYPDLFKSNADEAIDYFNKTNSLSGDDFMFLEKGRKITVYV